ncbi:hypothetical protein EYZ11_001721 [Aspergillus tanneri]|nr:hypothetical protein EYZ11_001721 [Aspergillus tanneri]
MEALIDEAFIFCFAANDTTSYALTWAIYYLLTHTNARLKLAEELWPLQQTANGLLTYEKLGNLPYLTGVIKETLRLTSPVPWELPRIVPQGGIWLGDQYIPPGTLVCMGTRMVHYNPQIFPDPGKLSPRDDWVTTAKSSKSGMSHFQGDHARA